MEISYINKGINEKIGICDSLCQKWFESCGNEYYDITSTTFSRISPCNEDSIICSQIKEMYTNSSHFCNSQGFSVHNQNCFDGTPSIRNLTNFSKPPKPRKNKDYTSNDQIRIPKSKVNSRKIWDYIFFAFSILVILIISLILLSYFRKLKPQHRNSPDNRKARAEFLAKKSIQRNKKK